MGIEPHFSRTTEQAAIERVCEALKDRFGERFMTGQAVREQHGHTTTYLKGEWPDGVVMRAAPRTSPKWLSCATKRMFP